MKKLFILFILITNCAFMKAPMNSKEFDESVLARYEQLVKEEIYFDIYDEVLIKLKEFEGLRLTAYADAGGKSIGYGHHIRSFERISAVITEEYAEALLRIDFEKAIRVVENNTNFNRYDNPEKVLALANFVFNLGSGNFQNSTMLKNIKAGKPIDNEIVRWNKVKRGDEVLTYSHLTMRRNYELNLYNRA